MTGFDIDSLMAIKDSFQGHNFQWVKTQDRAKLGKIVRVTDVIPGNKGRFIAQLSDGSQIPTDQLSSNLMMVMDDQPAMSMTEILSINQVPGLDQEISISPTIPEEFAQTIAASPKLDKPQSNISRQVSQSTDPGDLFGMFSLEETDLNLTVSIKLPAKNLLKMMYINSQNKEEFLGRLSAYINNNVTVDSIKASMKKSLDPDKKKKS
jgi:hypothetical protein